MLPTDWLSKGQQARIKTTQKQTSLSTSQGKGKKNQIKKLTYHIKTRIARQPSQSLKPKNHTLPSIL